MTQADIARAIRALRAAGYGDVRVVFRDGGVIVEPVRPAGEADASAAAAEGPERIVPM